VRKKERAWIFALSSIALPSEIESCSGTTNMAK